MGSKPTAAGGGRKEASEWQRSTDAKERRRRRQMSGTATGTPVVLSAKEGKSVCVTVKVDIALYVFGIKGVTAHYTLIAVTLW